MLFFIESLGEWDWYCMRNIVRVVFCKSQEAIEFTVVRNWILNDQSIWKHYRLLHFNNQSIFLRSNGYLSHFFHCFFYSSTEFRCTWFESVEHNGCFRTSTTRHRSLHRTLLDFIGKWCTQFREFTLWIQLNTGFDWSLRKMLVSVCICWNEISSIYSMINDLIFFSLSFIWN